MTRHQYPDARYEHPRRTCDLHIYSIDLSVGLTMCMCASTPRSVYIQHGITRGAAECS